MTEAELRLTSALAAAKWLGTREGSPEHKALLDIYNGIRPLPRGYAVRETDPWCAAFVSAAAVEAGVGELVSLECSCSKLIEGAKALGIWVEEDDHVPGIGDWVLYNWQASGSGDDRGAADHVGVVIAVREELLVVEGNCDDAVKLRRVLIDGAKIRGFICPRYETLAKEETVRYHTLEEVPGYARETIEKLTADGSLRGIAEDDLGLTEELVRTLVILDRRGQL